MAKFTFIKESESNEEIKRVIKLFMQKDWADYQGKIITIEPYKKDGETGVLYDIKEDGDWFSNYTEVCQILWNTYSDFTDRDSSVGPTAMEQEDVEECLFKLTKKLCLGA